MGAARQLVLALGASLLLVAARLAASADSPEWESRRLERELAGEIQARILDPMLGRGRAFAFVSLDVELTSKRGRNARSGQGLASRYRSKGRPMNADLFAAFGLGPASGKASERGRVYEAEQGQRAIQAKDEEEIVSTARWLPKRVAVTILHDQGLPAENLSLAAKAVADAYPEWKLDPGQVTLRPMRLRAAAGPGTLGLPALLLGLLAAGLAVASSRRGRPPQEPGGPERAGGFSPRPLTAPLLAAGALAATVFVAEGAAGFRPFLNLEALALVLVGTLGIVGASYPLAGFARAIFQSMRADPDSGYERWRSAEILATGARAAVASGLIGTALGVVLLLSSVDDVAAIPRRLALALTSGVFGLFLSEFVLAPMARRCRGAARGPSDDEAPRQALGASAVGLGVLALFAILYALSASLRS